MGLQRNSSEVTERAPGHPKGPGPEIMSARSLASNTVVNYRGEPVGDIVDIMIDMRSGRVCFAVLSLGTSNKLFAVPWVVLNIDGNHKRFILTVERDRLANAPSFEKNRWPDMSDLSWEAGIHRHYGTRA